MNTPPRPGDFGVTRTSGFGSWVIRVVTRSKYNHAFIVIDAEHLIEGEPGGARPNKLTAYPHAAYSSINLTDAQRNQIVAWAKAHIGTPYSWLDDLEIGLVDLFGWAPKWMRKRLSSTRTLMCSQLVDAAYAAAGVQLFSDGRPAGGVSPGDLARLIDAP